MFKNEISCASEDHQSLSQCPKNYWGCLPICSQKLVHFGGVTYCWIFCYNSLNLQQCLSKKAMGTIDNFLPYCWIFVQAHWIHKNKWIDSGTWIDSLKVVFCDHYNKKPWSGLLCVPFNAKDDAWSQVITLCERLAGQDANVTTVPVSVLRLTRQLTRLFEWTNDVADRLAFSEVMDFLYFIFRVGIKQLLSVSWIHITSSRE